MKTFKQKLLAPLGILSVLGMLASCGPTPTGENSSSSSGGGSSSSTIDAKKVEFSFWHTLGAGTEEPLLKKINEFQDIIKQEQGVDVTINAVYQGSYDDIMNKITKGFAAGNIPTIAVAYPDHIANYLADEVNAGDYVYNLDEYINDPEIGFNTQKYLGDEADEEDFVQAFFQEGQQFANKGTYSLPYMKSSEVMFYNLEALLIAAPKYDSKLQSEAEITEWISNISWDDFLDFCSFITGIKDEVLTTMEQPLFYDSDANLFISKMYQNEIAYSSINEEGIASIDFEYGEDRQKTEAMLQQIKDAYDNKVLVTKGTQGTYGSDSFKNGKSIFTIGSSGGTGYNDPSGGSFSVRACKVPASNNNPLYVTQGPTLTFLKNPSVKKEENDLRMKYAWQFAKFITNAENNVELCLGSQGYLPVRESAYTTEAFIQYLEEGEIYAMSANVLLDDIDGRYITSPVFKGSAKLRDECGGLISEVCSGNIGIKEGLDNAINAAKNAM